MTDNQNLLAEYARNGSDAAFRELVTRYVDLVYSTALRLVEGDTHRAEDVTQTVFVNLARKARTLPVDARLGGWLHRDTCLVAGHTLRGERRRQARERQAVEMNALQNHSEADFSQVAPLLDEAINELDEADRTAILLRFYEQQDFRSVGQALGSNEDAARMRVTRALEKLEDFLKRRGVTTTAASLGVVLAANAVQAAPVGLAVSISAAAAFAGTSIATTTIATATKIIAMTTLQKTLVTAILAIAVGGGIYETRQVSQLREQNQTLQQQQAPLTGQNQQLQQERDDATRKLVWLQDENDRLKSNSVELLRLRGEVGLLKQTAVALSNKLARASEPYGLLPEQRPPAISSGVPDTAAAYERLVKKLAAGQLSAAEELNLLKAWPYLERRFPEPDGFAYFQSEYLASMMNITNKDTVWGIRRLLESAREEEHAKGLGWARQSDEELQRYNIKLDITNIREQWNVINQKTTQQILELLPEDQQSKLASAPWQILDFDSRLKSGSQVSLSDPRFQNLNPQEVSDAFLPPRPGVRYVPATKLERQ